MASRCPKGTGQSAGRGSAEGLSVKKHLRGSQIQVPDQRLDRAGGGMEFKISKSQDPHHWPLIQAQGLGTLMRDYLKLAGEESVPAQHRGA